VRFKEGHGRFKKEKGRKRGQPELVQFESIEKGSEQTGTFLRHSKWGGQLAPLGYGP